MKINSKIDSIKHSQVINTLDGAIDYLDKISLLKNSISNHLNQDDYNEAWNNFKDMTEGLDTLNQLLMSIKKLYSIDFKENCNGKAINKRITEFNLFLDKIINGMENKDFIEIADLIEFEFEEYIESYKNVFICIKDFIDNIN